MEESVDDGAMGAQGMPLGRRPLLMAPNKSQMLTQIRNSLSHLHKDDASYAHANVGAASGANPGFGGALCVARASGASGAMTPTPSGVQTPTLKSQQQFMYTSSREMTKSTPNLFDASTKFSAVSNEINSTSTNSVSTQNVPPRTGMGYKAKEMQRIRQSLKDFEIAEGNATDLRLSPNGANGYIDKQVNSVNENCLQYLIQQGYPQDIAYTALQYAGNKLEDAVDIIKQFNGYALQKFNTSNGPIPYDQKAGRPIFENRYRAGSPVSSIETSSVRSESPSLSSTSSSKLVPSSPDPRWNTVVPSPLLTPPIPPQPNTQRRMSSPSDGTPPPLPPRGVPRHGSSPSRPPTPPPPVPNRTYKEAANQRPMISEQLKRRITPAVANSRDAFRPTPNPPVMGSGPVTPHNGPNIMKNNIVNNGYIPSGMATPPTGGQIGYRHQNHVSGGGFPPQHISLEGQVLSDTSPLSSNSPSPAPTPSPGAMVQNYSANQLGPWQKQGSQPPPPVAMTAWGCKHPPIVLQQVKSKEVTKPKLQTATVPIIPPNQTMDGNEQTANYVSSVQAHVNDPYNNVNNVNRVLMPSGLQQGVRNVQIEIRPSQGQHPHHQGYQHQLPQSHHTHHQPPHHPTQYHPQPHQHPQQRTVNVNYYPQQGPNIHIHHTVGGGGVYGAGPHSHHHHPPQYPPNSPRSESPTFQRAAFNQSPMSVMSSNSASTNSDIPDKPPPPYPGGYPHLFQANPTTTSLSQMHNLLNANAFNNPIPIQYDDRSDTQSNAASESSRMTEFDEQKSTTSEQTECSSNPGTEGCRERTHRCVSPKPERKADAKRKDEERFEAKVKQYSPAAYKFFMEQHIENVLKATKQRQLRRSALEREMDSCSLSEESKQEMRKMLFQKESNHNRLKRAKMDKSLFDRIKTLGLGAFGEVTLVRKMDTHNLYAMKTLRKRDVLQRNQVAHVKAERDILAEADCEWVVKLYYSFQDKENLYFIMDYIPGGDMMSLLIKLGIFEEDLTRFYIAELVLAIESVHNMGFIHRDIKPDNILIDKDGHIKLTDFGLCTGFRWTHNSKYYQKGNHARQDSMEPFEHAHHEACDCDIMAKELLKPLERRKQKHQRCQAHSLVGTPNYIAPEVLRRAGYSRCCDWWSVGVILYEMLVGSPPFLANTPQETQLKVVNWQKVLKIPRDAKLSPPAESLIHSLLISEDRRLGRNGAGEIKEHPFFKPLSFEGLRQTKAPFVPQIRYPTDTSNFDSVPDDKFRSLDSRRDGTLENGYPEHAFFEFTFKRFFDEGGHAVAMKIPVANGDDESAVFV